MFAAVAVLALSASAQVTDRKRPAEWTQLVKGARFMDRFLPMEGKDLRSDVWGADSVRPRLLDNGIEDASWSYWGGNIVLGDDGLWHHFVAAWPEASPKGHMYWPNSWVIHAVGPTMHGPFRPKEVIGRGHNPEIYRTDNGTYVLYVIDGRYTAPSINGPWTYGQFDFDPQGKPIIEGLSNLSFARRPDGSWLMVCRGGGIWTSTDGLSTWRQLSDGSVYPKVDGRFEDPVLWRDSVQYHLIVNDWLGRIAYYLRSPDGLHWTVDDGEAYMPGIARHKDGSMEHWFKYERMRIVQDAQGRAVQANFAVIDTIKWEDKPYDRHSSKNICIPLDPGLMMSMPATSKLKDKKIDLRIIAEEGFEPQRDLDLKTLRFGNPHEVDYGRGAAPVATKQEGRDIILSFNMKATGLTAADFAAKVIVTRKDGRATFGFVRLPWFVEEKPEMYSVASPNGKITLDVTDNNCIIRYQKKKVLEVKLPIAVKALKASKAKRVKADYKMLAGKKSRCTNEATEYTVGPLILRLYNDGLAYRFDPDAASATPSSAASAASASSMSVAGGFPAGTSAYLIPEGCKRWAMNWSDGYEGFYPLKTSVNSSRGERNKRWAYPYLIEPTDGVFALITEANIEHGQSASSLHNDGETFRVVPDETIPGKAIARTPWRVVIVGELSDVVESTLVTDVSDPSRIKDVSWIKPGVVSWVYWAYNHGSNDCNIIKKYTDLAATLHLPYVLIDAEWDEMKDGKTIEDAVAYAKSQGVKPLIWYNSCTGWINGAPGPKFRLNKPEDREREFAWCEKIGVAGVKIDFFGGDNQLNMDYCIDLLEAAARHHLLVNFHGATIPRGWQRTYPNLLSTEGVYGAEWYNNVGTFTDRAACHTATLPFTRNVVGPMDYTPCAFSDSQHPHITTHAHELALTVLFECGLQHLADRPESFLAQPSAVQDFLSNLPAAWDETHLISGYPGESAVIARRSGKTWYVGGINGTDQPKSLNIEALKKYISGKVNITAFKDADQDRAWTIDSPTALPTSVSCRARGGFVLVIKK